MTSFSSALTSSFKRLTKRTMNAIPVLLLLLSLAPCLAGNAKAAEEQPAPPLQHKRKVFLDEKEKCVYWPMSKPFWIRLATSPDQNAPSFPLEQVHPGPNASKLKDMNRGIDLEIQGKQFVRWFDIKTGKTTYLKFYADGEPPLLETRMTGAPPHKSGDALFYGKGLTCSISAKDDISGLAGIYVSIDGKPFQPYTGPISPEEEKHYHIRAYAVDRVGYAGEPVSIDFTVDLTPPQTRHQVAAGNRVSAPRTSAGQALPPSAAILLQYKDNASGVKETRYNWNHREPFTPYTGKAVKLANKKDGEYTLFYYSEDHVQNRETPKTYTFYLDRTPPSVSARIDGDLYHTGNTPYVSPRSRIILEAADNKAGVGLIAYKINNKKPSTYGEPFPVPTKQGAHTITFNASDKLGNTGAPVKLAVLMDNTPPSGTHTIRGPQFKLRTDVWITKNTAIHLAAKDKLSGLKAIYYQPGDPAEFRLYDGPVTFTEEGRYRFTFYSTDKVNNKEPAQTGIFIVDNSPPKLVTTFSLNPRGNTYPRHTQLFLGATDNSSGIAAIHYSINDGKEQVYIKTIPFHKPGAFTVNIRVEDNVGNASKETIQFSIQ
jgi:hypothetical protein